MLIIVQKKISIQSESGNPQKIRRIFLKNRKGWQKCPPRCKIRLKQLAKITARYGTEDKMEWNGNFGMESGRCQNGMKWKISKMEWKTIFNTFISISY